MSEDTPIGLTLITKIVGLVLIILGAAIAYFSSDAPTGVISNFSGIFVGLGVVVAVVGFGLLLIRGQ
jgi:protein-S-isoprenylcysteine O-methyltransferase Ste14